MADQLAAKGTSKRPEFAALLSMNPLFAGLGDEAIRSIAALCTRRHLDEGEVLFQKGDEGDALFGVRRGRVRIETGTAAGGRLALNVLGPGDLFGEIALFDGQPRTADAIAAEASELFMVRRSDFLAYLEREPRVTVRLLEMLCQRIRWVSDRMEEAVLLQLQEWRRAGIIELRRGRISLIDIDRLNAAAAGES